MYISLMSNVVAEHGLCYHPINTYADDTQLYKSVRPRSDTDPFRTLTVRRRHLSLVSPEQTTAESIED